MLVSAAIAQQPPPSSPPATDQQTTKPKDAQDDKDKDIDNSGATLGKSKLEKEQEL